MVDTVDTGDIGEYVKAHRTKKGLTQEQLAVHAGLSTSTVTRLERGKIDPDTTTLRSLARVLNVSAAELLGESVQRPTFYPSLRAFFEEHPLLPVNDGERSWLLSHRFPEDRDIGDKDYWMAQLILFRQQVRAMAGMQSRESVSAAAARRPG